MGLCVYCQRRRRCAGRWFRKLACGRTDTEAGQAHCRNRSSTAGTRRVYLLPRTADKWPPVLSMDTQTNAQPVNNNRCHRTRQNMLPPRLFPCSSDTTGTWTPCCRCRRRRFPAQSAFCTRRAERPHRRRLRLSKATADNWAIRPRPRRRRSVSAFASCPASPSLARQQLRAIQLPAWRFARTHA